MPNSRRRRKKAAKKMAGLPRYQTGGEIYGPPNPNTPAPANWEVVELPGGLYQILIDGYPAGSPYRPETGPGGTGGTGTSYSVSDIGPTSAAIQREQLAAQTALEQEANRIAAERNTITSEIARIQAQIDREKLAAESAIANRNAAEAERHNQMAEYLNALQLTYTAQRDQKDRELAYYNSAIEMRGQDVAARGQDVTQRGQTIEAGVTQRGQDIQSRTSGAGQLGELAGLEQQRNEYYGNLAANPRNFVEYIQALGGGNAFFNQLAQGQTPTGQGLGNVTSLPLADQLQQEYLSRIGTGTFDEARAAANSLLTPPPREVLPENVAAIGQPSPFSGMSPIQQASAEQFHQAAPQVPIDIAANIGANPEAARQYFQGITGAKSGATLKIDEPIIGVGLMSGQPKFTLGEQTDKHPMGTPEMMQDMGSQAKVTPMSKLRRYATGGSLSTVPSEYSTVGQPYQPPTTPKVGEYSTVGQQYTPPVTQPTYSTVGQPYTPPVYDEQRYQNPAEIPATGSIAQRLVALAQGPGSLGQKLVSFSQFPGAQPMAGTPQAAPPPPPVLPEPVPSLSRQAILQRYMRYLGPSSYFNLNPTQNSIMDSIISALGVPPEDFRFQYERGLPRGLDPSQIFSSGF